MLPADATPLPTDPLLNDDILGALLKDITMPPRPIDDPPGTPIIGDILGAELEDIIISFKPTFMGGLDPPIIDDILGVELEDIKPTFIDGLPALPGVALNDISFRPAFADGTPDPVVNEDIRGVAEVLEDNIIPLNPTVVLGILTALEGAIITAFVVADI